MITGLIMAGGKGRRMIADTEKPLLNIAGKPMILYVIDAVRGSKKIENVVVATSRYTPRTAETLTSLGIRVFETPGMGYVEDTQIAVKSLGLGETLVVSADLPLLSSDLIDEVIHTYQMSGKPALAVLCPRSLKQKTNPYMEDPHYEDAEFVPVGVNVIDGRRIYEEELREESMVVERLEVTLNVNTLDDLRLARSLIDKIKPIRRK